MTYVESLHEYTLKSGRNFHGTLALFREEGELLLAFVHRVYGEGYQIRHRYSTVPDFYANNPFLFTVLAKQMQQVCGARLVVRRHCAANETEAPVVDNS